MSLSIAHNDHDIDRDADLETKHAERTERAKKNILHWQLNGTVWNTSNKSVVRVLQRQACNSRLVQVTSSNNMYTVLMGIFAYDTIVSLKIQQESIAWHDTQDHAGPVQVVVNNTPKTIYTSKYCILFPVNVVASKENVGTPVGCECPDWHYRYHNDTALYGSAMHGCKHMIAVKIAIAEIQ